MSSDGIVAVEVVDDTQVTGASYEVRFRDTEAGTVWDLINLSSGQAVLSDMQQHASLDQAISNPIVEGLLVRVTGPPLGIKDWDIPSGVALDPPGQVPNWGAEGFGGAMTGDVAHMWFSPTSVSPSRLVNVELRFTSVIEDEGEDQYKPLDLTNPNVSYGYRYLRGAGAPPPAPADQTTDKVPLMTGAIISSIHRVPAYMCIRIAIQSHFRHGMWKITAGLKWAGWRITNPAVLVNGAYGPAYHNDVQQSDGRWTARVAVHF